MNDVLQKLTLRTMKLNPKRTLVTIVGIVLATALITAVANMAVSLEASLIEFERTDSGDYHYLFTGVDAEDLVFFRNNRMIRQMGVRQNVGYAPLAGSLNKEKPYFFIMAMDENGVKANAIRLIEGRLPQAEGEIVVPQNVGTNGGVDIRIGDVLELTVGDRVADGSALGQTDLYREREEEFAGRETVCYTVVGRIESVRTALERAYSPGYTAVTYLDPQTARGKLNVYVSYTKEGLKKRNAVNAGLLGITPDQYEKMDGDITKEKLAEAGAIAEGLLVHRQLVILETHQRSGLSSMLYLMAALAIAIIMMASVFCIRNSFTISLTEKMRLYGMLSSVGATRKQMRGMVYREAFFLGLGGIPLGVFCGVAATVILVRVASGLTELIEEIRLIYKMSLPAILGGAALSAVTLFFSAGQSARRAARVSPISAIRGNSAVRIRRRERRMLEKLGGRLNGAGRVIRRLFGIGGVIAYKNLCRSREKYRTTVISIVVSVAVFIATSALLNIGFLVAGTQYEEYDWQLLVTLGGSRSVYQREVYEEALRIAGLEGIEAVEICRGKQFEVDAAQLPYSGQYQEDFPWVKTETQQLYFRSLGEAGYKAYCKKLGLNADEIWDQAILVADYSQDIRENGETITYRGELYECKPGDVLTGVIDAGDEEIEVSVTLAAQTDEHPMSISGVGGGFLIVSDRWIEQYEEYLGAQVNVHIRCGDPDALEKTIISDMGIPDGEIYNMAQTYERSRAIYTLLGIFLYGFITVIALIGVTNIFNTITTNMELRSREFAMLQSVGMTGKEFRRMIWLENIFYGVKALAFGIPIGWLLYAAFYWILDLRIRTEFKLPWGSTWISVAAVAVLLAGIMRYSVGKIRGRNIVETIQNENI